MQADLDLYLDSYNAKRPYRGRKMDGKTIFTIFFVFTAGIPQAGPPAWGIACASA